MLSEEQLRRFDQQRDPAAIPQLVGIIQQQQHDLDNLRLSADVAQRDREELRIALIRSRQAEAAARAELQTLTRGAHDLRHPLTAIQFALDLLCDELPEARGHLTSEQALDLVQAAADRVEVQLEKLLRTAASVR